MREHAPVAQRTAPQADSGKIAAWSWSACLVVVACVIALQARRNEKDRDAYVTVPLALPSLEQDLPAVPLPRSLSPGETAIPYESLAHLVRSEGAAHRMHARPAAVLNEVAGAAPPVAAQSPSRAAATGHASGRSIPRTSLAKDRHAATATRPVLPLPTAHGHAASVESRERIVPSRPAPAMYGYFLQAGAFQTTQAAEAHRARIALLGARSHMEPAMVGGLPMYRVRLGPFSEASEVHAWRVRLAHGGIAAVPVTGGVSP
jgi:cell division septation protein DedD